MEAFDSDTLFYDAVRGPRDENMVLIGPPLLNLRYLVDEAEFTQIGCFKETSIKNGGIFEMNCCSEIWLEAPEISNQLRMRSNFLDLTMTVNPNREDLLLDRRVLFTVNKNNELIWIRDWISWHVSHHAADAVLIYDNQSSRYAPEELLEEIRRENGLEAIVIVRWPFKYGPQGYPWDSAFCQNAAFAHARWSLLGRAKSILNCDIDELVVPVRGTNVFELCENSGYIRIGGRWCYTTSDIAQTPRHSDHRHVSSSSHPCAAKWALVPTAIHPDMQWDVHRVRGLEHFGISDRIKFWHFHSINTSWKQDRTHESHPPELSPESELSGMFHSWSGAS